MPALSPDHESKNKETKDNNSSIKWVFSWDSLEKVVSEALY
jgi:hypothetical protein